MRWREEERRREPILTMISAIHSLQEFKNEEGNEKLCGKMKCFDFQKNPFVF